MFEPAALVIATRQRRPWLGRSSTGQFTSAAGVAVPEWAGEEEVTASYELVMPAVGVADDVVMATHRPEITCARGAGFDPRDTMVDVTVDRWHAPSRMDTGGAQYLGLASLSGDGSAPGDTSIDGLFGIRVVQRPTLYDILLVFGNLPSNVCNDGPDPFISADSFDWPVRVSTVTLISVVLLQVAGVVLGVAPGID